MSTPNPLIPQGSFQSQAARGASNVRIAVATVLAVHIVFFGGILLQGCKKDGQTASSSTPDTNAASTNLSLPPIDSNSLFLTNASSLPPEPSSNFAVRPSTPETFTSTRLDSWQSTNLGTVGNFPEQPAALGPMKEYTIVTGDSFGKIAKSNGTTVSALRKANPNVDPAKIRPGMKINVPASVAATSATHGAGTEAVGSAPSGNTYTVKAGDTLTKIAKTHKVTVGQLRSANNLKTSALKAGQKLKIPAPSPEMDAAKSNTSANKGGQTTNSL